MVKVNEKDEPLKPPGNDPLSSMSSDGSFVVLGTSPHESERQPVSHITIASQPPSLSAFTFTDYQPPTNLPESLSSDLSPEEVHKKLEEVMQHNLRLKELLYQNNLSWKRNYQILLTWQEELSKQQQKNNEKFAENREFTMKLIAENKDLKRYIEESKLKGSNEAQLETEKAALQKKIVELEQRLSASQLKGERREGSIPSKKEQELSSLVEQLTKQLETAERAKRQLIMDNERLNAQKNRLDKEMDNLKAELEQQKTKSREPVSTPNPLETENMNLKEKIVELEQRLSASQLKGERQEGCTPSKKEQELSSLVEQLTKQLETAEQEKLQQITENQALYAQKCRLDKELDDLKAKLHSASNLAGHGSVAQHSDMKKNEKTDFVTNLRTYEKQLQEINTNLEEKTERYTTLDSWLQIAADNVSQWNGSPVADPVIITSLRKEIQDLRELLIKEQSFGHEKKINLAEAQSQFQKLFSDYQELLEEWESFHEEQKTKTKQNNDYHEVQVRGYIEKIDNITAQLMTKEEALAQKNKQIEKLTESINKLKLENEEIPILKAQADVYQSDFNAEREARANLAGEKEKLADDLRRLHRQNEDLHKELEKLRRERPHVNSGWNTISNVGRSRVNGQSQQQTSDTEDRQRIYNEEIPPRKTFLCPKCSKSFPRLDHLEFHVETCLDLTN